MQLQKWFGERHLKYRKNIITDANMLDSPENKTRKIILRKVFTQEAFHNSEKEILRDTLNPAEK